jgi:WD40 repeat protein
MSEKTPLPNPAEQSLEDVLAQYIAGEETGGVFSQQEFLRQHPQHAADLREFFANRDQMQRLAEPLRSNAANHRPSVPLGKIRYFGDYELLEEVAAGGMGIVYKARQLSLNRVVAVKMILKGTLAREDDVKRFRAEAEAAASLQHPAIVAIHEVGLHEGQHYFSMDYVEGYSLAQLPRKQPLSACQAAEYVRDAAEAVHYAHQQGTLHRDLKPSNILIDSQGRVRITDFGLAKRIEGNSDLTLTGQILGTPSYMPPEQASGKRSLIGAASDVYSLGAVLYELLTGRPPFRGESPTETLRQVETFDPISPRLLSPTISSDLETICLKCLEKEPHRRYGTARLLADDLGRFLRGEPIVARPIGRIARAWRWCKRKPVIASLASISIAASLLAAMTFGVSYIRVTNALRDRTQALEDRTSALDERTQALDRLAEEEEKVQEALAEKTQLLGNLKTTVDQLETTSTQERRVAYANQINLAHREWLAGDLVRAEEILDACRPEQRHWEWHYLKRQFHPDSLAVIEGNLLGHIGSRAGQSSAGQAEGVPLVAIWQSEESNSLLHLVSALDGSTIRTVGPFPKRWAKMPISFDGTHAAFAVYYREGQTDRTTVELRELTNAQVTASVIIKNFVPGSTVCGPHGKFVVVAGRETSNVSINRYQARVWKPGANTEIRVLYEKQGRPSDLWLAPDGSRLICVNGDGFSLWDTATWTSVHKEKLAFGGGPTNVGGFDFEGNCFALVNAGQLVLWDAKTGERQRSYALAQRNVSSVSFGDRGRKIAYSTGSTVRLLDLEFGAETVVLRQTGTTDVLMTEDGSRLITTRRGERADVQIWNTAISQEAFAHGNGQKVRSTATFSSDGRWIAAASDHKSVYVLDCETRQVLQELEGYKKDIYDVAFSPDQRFLASTGGEGVKLWDLEMRLPVWSSAAVQTGNYACRVTFSADGKWLAATHSKGATIWNLTSGEVVQKFDRAQKGEIWFAACALSKDGTNLVTGGSLGALQWWDVASGRELTRFEEDKRKVTFTAAFSPDDSELAACGPANQAIIFDSMTKKPLRSLKGHQGSVNTVNYSCDGKRIVTAGGDGTLRIWDAHAGLELLVLRGHHGSTSCASFGPDCRHIVSMGAEGTLRIWNGTPITPLTEN